MIDGRGYLLEYPLTGDVALVAAHRADELGNLVYRKTTLLTRDGRPKLVPECTYPLTGLACVSRVYTDLAVFLIEPGRVVVRDLFGTNFGTLATLVGIPLVDGTLGAAS